MATAQAADIARPISAPLRRAILAMVEGGESLYTLAAASGVEVGTLARFARGECGLRLESVEKLFAALGLGMIRESDDTPKSPTDAIRSAIAAGTLGVTALEKASGVAHTTIAKFLDGRAGLETISADKLAAALGIRAIQGSRLALAPPERAGDAARPILDAILAEVKARGLDAVGLSHATGIRKAHLDRLLERRGDVRLATVDRLCEYLGIGFAVATDAAPAVPSVALRKAIKASGISLRKLSRLSGVVYQSIEGFMIETMGLELVSADRLAAALGLAAIRGPVARPPEPPSPDDPSLPYVDGLRVATVATGLSVYALSRSSGLSQPPIARFLKGERNLTTASIAKLARAVGFDPRPVAPSLCPSAGQPNPDDVESELAKLTAKQAMVARSLIAAEPTGLIGAAIRNASGVSGWWMMLKAIKVSGPFWETRVLFPPLGGTHYRINVN